MSSDHRKALIVSDNIVVHIQNHGCETYPDECCGALIGTDNVVTECRSLPNATKEGPRRRFLVKPDDYREAERHAMQCGRDLIGFYHSHPLGNVEPSPADVEGASYREFLYVILSPRWEREGRNNGELAGYWLRRNGFEQIRLSLVA